MTDILLTTAIISLTVLGVRTVTDEGMVGFPIRKWALKIDESSLFTFMKPLILCCVCMPSVWGLGIHLLIHGFSGIQYYPLEALSAAFINAVLWTSYEVLQDMPKYDESMPKREFQLLEWQRCPICEGTGQHTNTHGGVTPCNTCAGQGKIMKPSVEII